VTCGPMREKDEMRGTWQREMKNVNVIGIEMLRVSWTKT
jgi:hypothetical protein